MWRKFLGVGIPILIVGIILIIVGVTRSYDYWDYGYSDGSAWLMLFGYIFAVIGGLLVQAGLIGAAVGADVRSQARTANPMPAVQAPAPVVTYAPVVTPAPAPAKPAPTGKHCANCGQRNVEGAAFCANCGTSMTTSD